jgi:hypothetical protein
MHEFGMAVPQSRANAIDRFRKGRAPGRSQLACFRNQQELSLTIAGTLRLWAGSGDPARIARSQRSHDDVAGIPVERIANLRERRPNEMI